MVFANGGLDISVQDNGLGFEPAAMSEGNGLLNMKQRLANIHGDCVIESQPGHGTTVHLHLDVRPLEKPG